MKKVRTHQTGMSNLDFRSKQDAKALQIFQPWKANRSFGTMGQSNYHLSMNEYKKFFGVSERINKINHCFSETPDPKTYNTFLFYKAKKIIPKTKSLILMNNSKLKQLEETEKGKDPFIGDSLMYEDTLHFRKERKQQIQLKTKKIDLLRRIAADEKAEVKSKELQSQLKEKEAQIEQQTAKSIEKEKRRERIEGILDNIRKRYMSRGNWAKLFKDWDKSNLGEISVYDAHEMINRIGIPVNYNEARALLIAASTRGTDSLNLEEFLSMAFGDNPIQVENSLNVEYCDEAKLKDSQVINSFKQISQSTKQPLAKPIEVIYLENYLRTKVPILINMLKKEGSTAECSPQVLMKVLKSFPIPEKYTNDSIVKAIHEKYHAKDESGNVNFQDFIDHCLNKKNPNYFFDVKDKHMTLLKEKLCRAHSDFDVEIRKINESKQEKEQLRRMYLSQIEEKKIRDKAKDEVKLDSFSSMQPSKEFLLLSFKDLDRSRESMYDSIKKNSSLPSIYKLEGKTRLGGNPPPQNTSINVQADQASAMYQNEGERFKIGDNNLIDYIHKDKTNKIAEQEQRNITKANIFREFEKKQNNVDELLGHKNLIANYFKSARLFNYEYVNQLQNEFLES